VSARILALGLCSDLKRQFPYFPLGVFKGEAHSLYGFLSSGSGSFFILFGKSGESFPAPQTNFLKTKMDYPFAFVLLLRMARGKSRLTG